MGIDHPFIVMSEDDPRNPIGLTTEDSAYMLAKIIAQEGHKAVVYQNIGVRHAALSPSDELFHERMDAGMKGEAA